MTTQGQVKTSRRKPKKGTGPKSVRSKKGAQVPEVRFGLRADHVMLPCDDPEEFDALVRDLQEYWRPVGARERLVFDEIVDRRWTLQAIRKIRTGRLRKEYQTIEPEIFHEERVIIEQKYRSIAPEIIEFRAFKKKI